MRFISTRTYYRTNGDDVGKLFKTRNARTFDVREYHVMHARTPYNIIVIILCASVGSSAFLCVFFKRGHGDSRVCLRRSRAADRMRKRTDGRTAGVRFSLELTRRVCCGVSPRRIHARAVRRDFFFFLT